MIPQSGAELKSAAAANPFLSTKSTTISASVAASTDILRRMSSQCFNRTVAADVPSYGQFGGTHRVVTQYKGSVSTRGGVTALTVREKVTFPKIIGQPENGLITMVVEVSAGSSGTAVSMTGRAISLRKTLKTTTDSMNSGRLTCPKLSN